MSGEVFAITLFDEKPFYTQGDVLKGEVKLDLEAPLYECKSILLSFIGLENIEWFEQRLVQTSVPVSQDMYVERRKWLKTQAFNTWSSMPVDQQRMYTVDGLYIGLLQQEGIPHESQIPTIMMTVNEFKSFTFDDENTFVEQNLVLWNSKQGKESLDPGKYNFPFEIVIDKHSPSTYVYSGEMGNAGVKYFLYCVIVRDNLALVEPGMQPPPELEVAKQIVFKSHPITLEEIESVDRNSKCMQTSEKTIFMSSGVINYTIAINKNTFRGGEELIFEIVLFHNTGTQMQNFDVKLVQNCIWSCGDRDVVKFNNVVQSSKYDLKAQKNTRFHQFYKFQIPVVPESTIFWGRLINVSYKIQFIFPWGFEHPMHDFVIDIFDPEGCPYKISDKKYPDISLDNFHVWKPDHEVTQCQKCNIKFTLFNRRHHCRNCGQIFCGKCSSKTMILIGGKAPKRVCDGCFEKCSNQNTQITPLLQNPSQQKRVMEESKGIDWEGKDIYIIYMMNSAHLGIEEGQTPDKSKIVMIQKAGEISCVWKFQDGMIWHMKTGLLLAAKDSTSKEPCLQDPANQPTQKWKFEEHHFVNVATGLALGIQTIDGLITVGLFEKGQHRWIPGLVIHQNVPVKKERHMTKFHQMEGISHPNSKLHPGSLKETAIHLSELNPNLTNPNLVENPNMDPNEPVCLNPNIVNIEENPNYNPNVVQFTSAPIFNPNDVGSIDTSVSFNPNNPNGIDLTPESNINPNLIIETSTEVQQDVVSEPSLSVSITEAETHNISLPVRIISTEVEEVQPETEHVQRHDVTETMIDTLIAPADQSVDIIPQEVPQETHPVDAPEYFPETVRNEVAMTETNEPKSEIMMDQVVSHQLLESDPIVEQPITTTLSENPQ